MKNSKQIRCEKDLGTLKQKHLMQSPRNLLGFRNNLLRFAYVARFGSGKLDSNERVYTKSYEE